MGEEGVDIRFVHLRRVFEVIMENEPPDPQDVSLFGAPAVMA
jgi:hypothetical protein